MILSRVAPLGAGLTTIALDGITYSINIIFLRIILFPLFSTQHYNNGLNGVIKKIHIKYPKKNQPNQKITVMFTCLFSNLWTHKRIQAYNQIY